MLPKIKEERKEGSYERRTIYEKDRQAAEKPQEYCWWLREVLQKQEAEEEYL